MPSDGESNSPAVEVRSKLLHLLLNLQNDQPSRTKELVVSKNSDDLLYLQMRYPTKEELAETVKRMETDLTFKEHVSLWSFCNNNALQVPPLLKGFMAVDKFRYDAYQEALRCSENKSDEVSHLSFIK